LRGEAPLTISPGAKLMGFRGEPLILASRSPRRRHLLEMLGLRFTVLEPAVAEGDWSETESPECYVERLARVKARSIGVELSAHGIIAADTIVDLDGEVLEKPHDVDHARALLRRLSGCWHEVHSGICIRRLKDERILVGH